MNKHHLEPGLQQLCVKFIGNSKKKLLCFILLGGKDPVSSGFGYFMSAVVVLTLCLVTYIMLHRMVRVQGRNLCII